jgi:hypothetical protein
MPHLPQKVNPSGFSKPQAAHFIVLAPEIGVPGCNDAQV